MAGLVALPEELLQQIADHLDRASLRSLALTSFLLWDVATNSLWRSVNLIDTSSHHHVPDSDLPLFHGHGPSGKDDHDDAPIIRKLLVLARNKRLASKVRVLTHRCHLPLPAIFQDLPRMDFHNPTLSCDWRTMHLALLAVRNMDGVRLLRLLNGHYNLVSALLNGFYGRERKFVPPHLWVESCSLHGFPLDFGAMVGKENGLVSLRLRRLKMFNLYNPHVASVMFSRAKGEIWLHNGKGNTYSTPAHNMAQRRSERADDMDERFSFDAHIGPIWMSGAPDCVKWLNKKTYEQVPEAEEFLYAQRRGFPAATVVDNHPALHRQAEQESDTIGIITHFNANTLRSLNLDWILNFASGHTRCLEYHHFERLSQLKFPSLRAFQLRNAVTDNTLLPENLYLLHPYTHHSEQPLPPHVPQRRPKAEYRIDFLTFMENHPNLECLAWPMDRFYAALKPHEEDDKLRDRAATVVANLGRTLTNLRVDYYYTSRGEPQTDDAPSLSARAARKRRRLFISDFAAHMTKLTVLKLEGGIPRDEKREMMAATSRCPIEKLVMIAVSCPLGNTWGVNGDDLAAIDDGQLQFHGLLEAEPEEALSERTKSEFVPYSGDGTFRAEYGWPPGPSLLQSIATYHASTITELKFCGYNGSPILHKPTDITKSLLHHLRHFHRLQKVVMSFWLLTFFDFDWREPEIIDYWLDSREATSTALVSVPAPAPVPIEPPTWESMVAANTGAVDQDGDVTMSEQDASALAVGPVLGALSALNGNVDDADDLNPDAMMAAALGTGLLFATADGTIVPPTSTDAPPPPNPAGLLHHAPPPPTADTDTEDDTLEQNPWESYLHKNFSAQALSNGVNKILGPHLSPIALSSEEGVQIRASFCLGVESGDIFDLDFLVRAEKGGWGPVIGVPAGQGIHGNGAGDGRVVGVGGVRSQVVEGSWVGPREESEKGRWWGKLEERGWFG